MATSIEEQLSLLQSGGGCVPYPTVQIRREPYSYIYSGSVATPVAGTPAQLSQVRVPCHLIQISADAGNTNLVVIGDQNVRAAAGSARGVILFPGNDPVFFYMNDLSRLWIDVRVNNERCCFNYYVYEAY